MPIHIPQCREMWAKRQQSLSSTDTAGPGRHRVLAPEPAELSCPLPTDADDIDASNAVMFAVYNGASLVPCAHCGRTFR